LFVGELTIELKRNERRPHGFRAGIMFIYSGLQLLEVATLTGQVPEQLGSPRRIEPDRPDVIHRSSDDVLLDKFSQFVPSSQYRQCLRTPRFCRLPDKKDYRWIGRRLILIVSILVLLPQCFGAVAYGLRRERCVGDMR